MLPRMRTCVGRGAGGEKGRAVSGLGLSDAFIGALGLLGQPQLATISGLACTRPLQQQYIGRCRAFGWNGHFILCFRQYVQGTLFRGTRCVGHLPSLID